MATIEIRPLQETDRAAWGVLYAGYADFYRVTQTAEMRDRVWSWIHDPAHETKGLVALLHGKPVGLAHFRAFARPLSASTAASSTISLSRKMPGHTGAADALINALAEIGRSRGWTVIRWITAEDNARARKVYDRLALKTPWVTYDLKL